MALLPYFLPPKPVLAHTVVMIVLDWTRPWTFVDELETWVKWVELWAQGDGSREVEIAREENRERCTYLCQPTSHGLMLVQYTRICNITRNHLQNFWLPHRL